MLYNAKYTVVLASLMSDERMKEVLNQALSTYPIYTPKSKQEYIPSIIPTREELNKKLLNHYKHREIGFETVGRFVDELEIAMNEIMPYYNQLMFTQDQDYNIIYNVDYKRTTDTVREGDSKSEVEGSEQVVKDDEANSKTTGKATDSSVTDTEMSDNGKAVQSATPQSQLGISSWEIDSVKYADEAKWNNSESRSIGTTDGESETTTDHESNAKSTTKGTNTNKASGEHSENENVIETTKGNFGVVSAQDLVAKYREIIINIEQMIINDERIKELFLSVY